MIAPTSSVLGRRRQKPLWLKEEEGSCDGEKQSEALYLRWMASRFRRQGRYLVTRTQTKQSTCDSDQVQPE